MQNGNGRDFKVADSTLAYAIKTCRDAISASNLANNIMSIVHNGHPIRQKPLNDGWIKLNIC